MSSLIPKFLANIEQLELNQVPKTNSGKHLYLICTGRPFTKLKYKGEKYEKLTDDDVKNLGEALKNNIVFEGELNLSNNNLNGIYLNKKSQTFIFLCYFLRLLLHHLQCLDLSGLYVATAMKTFKGIRKLILSKNNLKSKTGEYIGDVLIDNPDYKISEIDLKGNKLEEHGIRRLIIAATKNHNITKFKFGVMSDFGLELLSNELINTNLSNIAFEEDEDHPFSERVKDLFIEKLDEIQLERVSSVYFIAIKKLSKYLTHL